MTTKHHSILHSSTIRLPRYMYQRWYLVRSMTLIVVNPWPTDRHFRLRCTRDVPPSANHPTAKI